MSAARLSSSSVVIALVSSAIFLAGCLYMAGHLLQERARLDVASQTAAAQRSAKWEAVLAGKIEPSELSALGETVAKSASFENKPSSDINTLAGWIILLLMALAAMTSLWIGLYLNRRMSAMRQTAEQIIETGNLSQRLPVDSRWDDLSRINIILNGVFERLENHVNAVESLSNNLAHDLRLPMSRLKARLEALPEAQWREELLSDVDELLDVFRALLRLTELDSGEARKQITEQDLTAIVSDAIDFYVPIAESKDIHIEHQLDPCNWRVDRHLIFQALTNLLDNALKFTPQGGRVRVQIDHSEAAGQLVISVSDDGPGVPLETHEQLTQRFYRGEASRTTPGHGLGLAMVQAIADVHNAQLTFSNGDERHGLKGLKASLEFQS